MSRPQFPINSQGQVSMQGPVINGGLIDFQDNFCRGMPDYSPALHHQMPPVGVQGFPYGAQQGVNFQQTAANYQVPGQVQCISGPPSFFHVNGITYKPVDEPQGNKGVQLEPKPHKVESAPEPAQRVLSEEEIDRRVRERVEMWAATQKKYAGSGTHTRSKAFSDEERAAARVHSVNASMSSRYRSPL
jgi:hypothetical protein